MKAIIKGRKIIFTKQPKRTELQGLKMFFKPSKRWIEENPYCHPVSMCNLIIGEEYKMPKHVAKRDVEGIYARQEDKWYKVYPLKEKPNPTT